jgi:hypothetical protein
MTFPVQRLTFHFRPHVFARFSLQILHGVITKAVELKFFEDAIHKPKQTQALIRFIIYPVS